ncbi:MAG: S49 family peptidase, partial [Methylococcaceae bacterium]
MTQSSRDPVEPSSSALHSSERQIIEKVLLASIEEQRRARRWGIFFKSLFAIYLGVGLFMAAKPFKEIAEDGEGHTAVIDVAGVIAPGQPASADNIIDGLREAVEDKKTKGILLRMNSPGGSPVQSAYVYDEIRRIKQQKPDLPIVAVISDMCASGCYYVASAADKIFVNNASVVGSIGVIMGSFGFVDAMKQWGVE